MASLLLRGNKSTSKQVSPTVVEAGGGLKQGDPAPEAAEAAAAAEAEAEAAAEAGTVGGMGPAGPRFMPTWTGSSGALLQI